MGTKGTARDMAIAERKSGAKRGRKAASIGMTKGTGGHENERERIPERMRRFSK